MKLVRNIIAFHGVDHKVGNTMISQSIAELIVSTKNCKILLACLNGRDSNEYVPEKTMHIDEIKSYIDNRIVNQVEFLKKTEIKGNFHFLGGVNNELEIRHYHPDGIQYFLEEIKGLFDLIFVDCGGELDNGLAVGSMLIAEDVFLVTSQQESSLSRYEKNQQIFRNLGINITGIIVNKYREDDIYDLSYVTSRIGLHRNDIWKIQDITYSRQAEIEKRTLLEYKDETFQRDLIQIANHILLKSGFQEIEVKRNARWKHFI